MKKGILCVMCAVLLAMSMVFSACSNSNGKFASMEDYAKSEAVQQQISSVQDMFGDSGMELSVTGEGNKLVYTYTYSGVTKSDALVNSLESGLSAQEETFTSLASTLKGAVNVENPVIEVVYLDDAGEEIYSQEFAAK